MQYHKKNKDDIIPKARMGVHEVILEWFDKQKRGSVLDVPAGYGHLSTQLKHSGFSVTAGEIEPEHFGVKDVKCVYMDLSNKIDIPDNSFDYVCCVDGLEHITNPYNAVAELARILKPGGYAVFSIPNYSNIEKRFKFLFHGYLTAPKTLKDFKKSGENLHNFHNSPLTITLLDLIFKINNLEIKEILHDKKKKSQMLLYIVYPLLKLISKLSHKKPTNDVTLKKDILFGGNIVIFILQKQ